MPKRSQNHSVSRQRPVSCLFCRSRKLRCSRENPCSNCLSRGIRCEVESTSLPTTRSPGSPEIEILERVRKLEELVQHQRSQQNNSDISHSENSETPATSEDTFPRPHRIEHLDDDAAWLESIYDGQDISQERIPSTKVAFRICPIQHILEMQPYINHNLYPSSQRSEISRCIWLPRRAEAQELLNKYVEDIDHVHPIVHTPSLPAILDEVYTAMNQQRSVKPGHAILLLGIFASSTHAWMPRDCARGLFATTSEASSQTPFWVKTTEDLLDIAHRVTQISIEGIQGMFITTFVLGNLDGISRRCRSLYNLILLLARELGLHKLDAAPSTNMFGSVQAEIGRRVWWYIVASDWFDRPKYREQLLKLTYVRAISGRLNSVAQGVYQCHLRHMAVKKPLNINDEDLIDGVSLVEKPLSQPTVMSYPLHRLRLAEISRSIIDRTPLIIADANGPSYDAVMDIDTELQLLLKNLPPFFSMSVEDVVNTYRIDSSRAAKIVHQGYMFLSLFYAQRCELHFPYFSRGYADSTYAYSREICLQSARRLVQTETQLENSGLVTVTRYKFLALSVGVFKASIVLLMDLCKNKSLPQQEHQRKELGDAFRILEEARQESKTAAKFSDSLMQVLRKHKVFPPKTNTGDLPSTTYPKPQAPDPPNPGTIAPSVQFPVPWDSSNVPVSNDTTGITNTSYDRDGEDLSSYFSEFAQNFDEGVAVASFDWTNIFSDLESSFI